MLKYNDIYLETRRALKEQGVSNYSIEARVIAALAAGKTPEVLVRDLNLYAGGDTASEARRLTERRLNGEPLAYITGEAEFYGLPFTVTRDVLIPRADTEVLVGTALEILRGHRMTGVAVRVLDLCAGSGCVGCAVAKTLPAVNVVLADNSAEVLTVARGNTERNGLSERVTCAKADATLAPPVEFGNFDLIVCNPPYIPTGDISGLDGSVRLYEPAAALDGGEDGMDFYRAILSKWTAAVKRSGFIVFEVGIKQAMRVMALMQERGMTDIGCREDLQGIHRVVFGCVQ